MNQADFVLVPFETELCMIFHFKTEFLENVFSGAKYRPLHTRALWKVILQGVDRVLNLQDCTEISC